MRSVEDTRPRPGLSVPVVTVLDESGALDDPVSCFYRVRAVNSCNWEGP